MFIYLIISLAILCVFFLYIVFFLRPIFTIFFLLLIRATIGPLRNISISFSGLNLNLLGIFSIFVCILGVIYLIIKKAKIKNSFFILYIIFCLWCLISISYSINKQVSIADFFRVFSPIMFYILIFNEIKEKSHIRLTIFIIILSSLFPIFYGFYQFFTHTGFVRNGIMRINSTFMFPNSFGFYLAFTNLITLNQISLERQKQLKIFLFLVLALNIICLILTGTRTAFMGFLTGLITYIFLSFKGKYILYIFPLICFVLLTQHQIEERLFQPLKSLSIFQKKKSYLVKTKLPKGKELWEMDTWEWRLYYWRNYVLKTYLKRPILGYGIGTSKMAISQNTLLKKALIPHNDYLRLLLEVGIIGFSLYIISFVFLLFDFFKYFLNSKKLEYKCYYNTIIAVIICFLTIMFADNIILSNTFLWYLFSIIAVTYNVRDIEVNYEDKNLYSFNN